MGEISEEDHGCWTVEEPFKWRMWNGTGINLLAIMMGVVFFFQEKYM